MARWTRWALALIIMATRAQALSVEPRRCDVASIRNEGLQRSQVMSLMTRRSDVYGPRLTGSPAIEVAGTWAMNSMRAWGLSDVHEERWPFGQGWALTSFHATLIAPQVQVLIALPKAWSRGTPGIITADVVRPEITTRADLARYRGVLVGKIVLMQPARRVRMLDGRIVMRINTRDSIQAMTLLKVAPIMEQAGGASAATSLAEELRQFHKSEGVVARLERGADADTVDGTGGAYLGWYTQHVDGGTFIVAGRSVRDQTARDAIPEISVAVEHYNRMVRVLDLDRVQAEDMTQIATVVASLAYRTAQRDEKLPRKPLPAPAHHPRNTR